MDLAHALEVARGVNGVEAKLVALLHDVVEDQDCSYEDLVAAGMPPAVLAAVEIVTRDPAKETYSEYITRVIESEDELAIRVKLADLIVNYQRASGKYAGLKKRYAKALARFGYADQAL